jgi:hypothetical protein
MQFGGRRPYRFNEPRGAASRRWELWADATQADALRGAAAEAAAADALSEPPRG